MKRDMDVVREILCKISAAAGKPDQGILVEGKSEEEAETIIYHVELMEQAGLLTGQPLGGIGMKPSRLAVSCDVKRGEHHSPRFLHTAIFKMATASP